MLNVTTTLIDSQRLLPSSWKHHECRLASDEYLLRLIQEGLTSGEARSFSSATQFEEDFRKRAALRLSLSASLNSQH
jgi:hypothetical protein